MRRVVGLALVGLAFILLVYKEGKKMTASPSRQEFAMNFLAEAARVDMKRIPVAMAMAVAALETGWGTGNVFKQTNSLFNIKATASWTGPVYQTKNSDGIVKFRAYRSWAESIRDWVALITGSSRYAKAYAWAVAGNFKEFFAALEAAGYAGSDKQYSEKLVSTMGVVQGVV